MRDKKIISILSPTRQRPQLAYRFAKSVMDTAVDLSRVELLFYVDDDDPCLEEYRQMISKTPFQLVVGKPIRVGPAWNILARKCKGDYLMMGNDDLVSITPGWDNILCKEIKIYDDEIFCAWFDDNLNGKKHCAFPIVSRRWVETIGYFMPECFSFFFPDTWLEDLGKRVKRLHYISSAVFEHRHFSTGKMERDTTTIRNRSRNQSKTDQDIYEANAHIRNVDAGKLLQQMSTFDFQYEKDVRLEAILTGKRVALIGPAGYLQGRRMGKHFDDYDVVCRVNEVLPFGQENDYGNRTDIIFHCCGKSTMGNFKRGLDRNEFITSQILFTVMPQASNHDNPENRDSNFAQMNKQYNLYYHPSGSKFWENVARLLGSSPNTGFLAILILLQYDIKELLISGFSFYKERDTDPEVIHSLAYKQFGGDDKKKIEVKLHKQQPQIDCLKNFILVRWKNKVMVDSYMNEIIPLRHTHVLNLEGLASFEPNFQCRPDLFVYLKNKKVAIVGPAPYLTNRGLGETINSYDVICRVNEVLPFGLEKDYGDRTDIIFHCCGKYSVENLKKALKNKAEITQKIKCIICPQARTMRFRAGVEKIFDTIENIKVVEEFDIPFYQVSNSYWARMNNRIGVRATANTGLLSILMLLEGFDVKELFITGFDFYTEGLQYYQRHHSAYLEFGGESQINHIQMSSKDGQSSVEYQSKQKRFFKEEILTKHKGRVQIDSHLSKLMKMEDKGSFHLPPTVYAVYRVLYGEDFIQESIKSILPFVTKVFVFWTNQPFGDVREVLYKGEKIVFPAKFDNVLGKVKELQDTSKGKIELIYDHWGVPDNQISHLVNERILPYHSMPDTIVFMEPDFVWREDQLKKAFEQFNGNGSFIAGSRQVELWKSFKYRVPERKRFGAIFYNMGELQTLPLTGKNGTVKGMKLLDAEVHNCGFCVSEKAMFWKHLTALAYAPVIADSRPVENWYEDKWLNWDFKRNNENLEISKGYEKEIPYAEPYDVKKLPEVLR